MANTIICAKNNGTFHLSPFSMCQNKTREITTCSWEMTQISAWNTVWLQIRFIKKKEETKRT